MRIFFFFFLIQTDFDYNCQTLLISALLSESTVMVLLNAIYFKGLWDVPFDKRFTLEDNFELAPENAVKVSMMSQVESFIAGEDSELGVQWVNLPFKASLKISDLF